MKKLVTAFFLLATASFQDNAALVSRTSYVFDDAGFVTSLDSFIGNVSSSTGTAAAITDDSLATWIYSPDGTGNVNLSFGTEVFNGTGSDLALFFLHGSDTGYLSPTTSSTVNLTINGYSSTASSSLVYLNANEFYGVITPVGTFGISVALIEFSDFGLNLDDSITSFSVGLNNSYLSLAGGFHLEPSTTVVPLPAPILLFLSGLTALGLIRRRK